MQCWKSDRIPIKHDVWISEIRLNTCSVVREVKVMKLLGLLKTETFTKPTVSMK